MGLREDKAKDVRLKRTYGITLREFNEKKKEQEGKCRICGQVPKTYLCVDHIHAKGYKKLPQKEKKEYVRGLLCFRCNTMIGKLERNGNRNREIFENIIKYFKDYRMKGE